MNTQRCACFVLAFLSLAFITHDVLAEDVPILVLYDWQYYNNKGWQAMADGKSEVAEKLFRKAIEIAKPVAKTDQRLMARSYHDLAWALYSRGRVADAEPLAKWAVSVREKYPADTKARAQTLNTLALIYMAQRRHEAAAPLYARAIPLWEQSQGAEHPDTAAAHHDLAAALSFQRKYDEAEPHYKRAIYVYDRLLNPEPESGRRQNADPRVAAGNRSYRGRRSAGPPAQQPPNPKALADSLIGLSNNYVAQARFAEAEPLLKRVLEMYDSKTIPEDDPPLASALVSYATLLRKSNRPSEAETLEDRARRIRVKNKTS